MRAWQLAACVAAMMAAHVAPATAEALVSAGLEGSADTGGVLGVTVQPGTHIARNFWLRVSEIAPAHLNNQQMPNPIRRPRRLATMLDFYPDSDSGLHLSAGMRVLSKRGRQFLGLNKGATAGSLLYAPSVSGRLPLRNNIARAAPAATIGWTTRVSSMAVLGLEAGTIMEHGGSRVSAATIAQPQLRTNSWSRVDPVAQVAFALKF